MIHWIIENQRYDARYLANANKAAAKADNEPTWTQTAWLVKINDGQPGTFLRGSDLGLPLEKRPKKKGDGEWEFDPFMVLSGGQPKPFDPNSDTTAVEGDLLVDTEIKGVKVKSVLQIYKETAAAKSWRNGPNWPGSEKRTWLSWPGNSPTTAKGRWPTFTGASPSTPPGSTTSSPT